MDEPPSRQRRDFDIEVRAGARSLLHTAQNDSYPHPNPQAAFGAESEATAVIVDGQSQDARLLLPQQKQEYDRVTQANTQCPTKIIKLTSIDLREGKMNNRYSAKQESFLSSKVKSEMSTPQRDSRGIQHENNQVLHPLQQSQTSTVRATEYPQNFTNLEMPSKHVDLMEANHLDMFSREPSYEIQDQNLPVKPDARPINRVSRASRQSKISSKSRKSPPTRASGSRKKNSSQFSEQPSISPIRPISGLQDEDDDEQPYERSSEVMKKSPPQEVQMLENQASRRGGIGIFGMAKHKNRDVEGAQRKIVTGESGKKPYMIEDKDLVPGSKIAEFIGTYQDPPSHHSPSQATEKSHDFMYPANHIYQQNKEVANQAEPDESPAQKIKQRLEFYFNPPESSSLHLQQEQTRPITSINQQFDEYDSGEMFQNLQLRGRYSALANSHSKKRSEKRNSRKRVVKDQKTTVEARSKVPIAKPPVKNTHANQKRLFQTEEKIEEVKERMDPAEAAAKASAFVQRQEYLERKKQERILRQKKEMELEKEKQLHFKPNIKRSQNSMKSAGARIPSVGSSRGSHYNNDLSGPVLGRKSTMKDHAASEGQEAPSIGKSIRSNSIPNQRAQCASQGLNSPVVDTQIVQESEGKPCISTIKSPAVINRQISNVSLGKDGESTPKPNLNPPSQSPIAKPSKPIQLRIHSRTGYVTYEMGNRRPSNSHVQKVFTNSTELIRKKMEAASKAMETPSSKKPVRYKAEGNIFDRLSKQPQLRNQDQQLKKLMEPLSAQKQQAFVSPINSKIRRVAGGSIRQGNISEMVMNIKQNNFVPLGSRSEMKGNGPTPTMKTQRLQVPTSKFRSPSEKTYERIGRIPIPPDLLRNTGHASRSERLGGNRSQFSSEKSIEGRQKSENIRLRSPRSSKFGSTMMSKMAQPAPSSMAGQGQQKLSSKTEKIILQKFNREFSLGLLKHIYPDEEDQQALINKPMPLSISFRAYKAVLSSIGCLSVPLIQEDEPGFNCRGKEPENLQHLTVTARKQALREWQLQNNLFDYLLKVQKYVEKSRKPAPNAQGEESLSAQERIPTGDLKLALLAIFGIKGNKRLGVSNPDTEDVANLNKDLEEKASEAQEEEGLEIGWIQKEDGKAPQLCLSHEDTTRLQKLYGLFNVTRIAFKGQSMRSRKMKAEETKCTFRPNLSASANSLTRKRQGSISSTRQNKTAIQRLLDKSTTKSVEKRQISATREPRMTFSNECTFKPDISNSQKRIRSASKPLSSRRDSRKNSIRSNQGTEGTKPTSRFEQLYQQSLVKGRTIGKPEEKIKKLTELELERKECTFKPKINSTYASPHRKPLVRPAGLGSSNSVKKLVSPILQRSQPQKKVMIPEQARLDMAKPSTLVKKQMRQSGSAPFIAQKKPANPAIEKPQLSSFAPPKKEKPAEVQIKEEEQKLSNAVNLQNEDGRKISMKEAIQRISDVTEKLNPLNSSSSTKRHSKVNSLRESKQSAPYQEEPPMPHPQKSPPFRKESSSIQKNRDIFPMASSNSKKEISPVLRKRSSSKKTTTKAMRSSGAKPPAVQHSVSSSKPKVPKYRPEVYGKQEARQSTEIKPVLKTRPSVSIEIVIDESIGLKDSLLYYPGDDLNDLATKFCDKHSLGKELEEILLQNLKDRVGELNKKRKQEQQPKREDRFTPVNESQPKLEAQLPETGVRDSGSSLKNLLERGSSSGKFRKRRDTNTSLKQSRSLRTPEPDIQGPPEPNPKATEPSMGSIDLIQEVEDDEVKIEEQFNVRFSEDNVFEEEKQEQTAYGTKVIDDASQHSGEEPQHPYNLYQKSEGGEPDLIKRRY